MIKKLPKIILIHGNGGSTADDIWFPYVKRELENLGLVVIAETFPDNKLGRQEFWLPFLKNKLKADENSLLIGQSTGAVVAMRFAEQNKIFGSVLVGASHTDLEEESEKIGGYFDKPWAWEKIKNNQNWIIQFASTDDPYIPIKEPRHIHAMLSTEYYEYTDRGHFGWDKHLIEFPELIQVVKKKLEL